MMIATVGASVRAMRGELGLSQQVLAARSGLSSNTVAGLEQGRGTIASLVAVLRATGHRLAHHYDPAKSIGQHVGERRRKLKLSFDRLAMLTGLSKPTLIGIEDGHGRISSLEAVLCALRLPIAFLPAGAEWSAAAELPTTPRSVVGRIIEGDCRELMPTLEEGSVDLVVTSPPYRAGKVYEEPLTIDEYKAFTASWLLLLPRLLTRRGSVWINLGYTKTTCGEAVPLTYFIYPIAQRYGFRLVQEIVWHYEGGMRYSRRFACRTERWMWLVRDLEDYEFRLDHLRDPRANRTIDRRNHPLGKSPTDYWYFDRVVGGRGAGPEKTSHPCQLPVPMIERIIQACSRVGDVVLDPFAGSGSVAVTAEKLGRGYIAMERDAGYTQEMMQRLDAHRRGRRVSLRDVGSVLRAATP